MTAPDIATPAVWRGTHDALQDSVGSFAGVPESDRTAFAALYRQARNTSGPYQDTSYAFGVPNRLTSSAELLRSSSHRYADTGASRRNAIWGAYSYRNSDDEETSTVEGNQNEAPSVNQPPALAGSYSPPQSQDDDREIDTQAGNSNRLPHDVSEAEMIAHVAMCIQPPVIADHGRSHPPSPESGPSAADSPDARHSASGPPPTERPTSASGRKAEPAADSPGSPMDPRRAQSGRPGVGIVSPSAQPDAAKTNSDAHAAPSADRTHAASDADRTLAVSGADRTHAAPGADRPHAADAAGIPPDSARHNASQEGDKKLSGIQRALVIPGPHDDSASKNETGNRTAGSDRSAGSPAVDAFGRAIEPTQTGMAKQHAMPMNAAALAVRMSAVTAAVGRTGQTVEAVVPGTHSAGPVVGVESAGASETRGGLYDDSGADTSGDDGSQAPPRTAVLAPEALPGARGTTDRTTSTPGALSTNVPLDRAQLVQQLTRHIESMRVSSTHGEMTLNLDAEHLGALRLTVLSDQHGVAARIVVETAQAHQAVESAKQQLKEALENRGLNLASLDVTLNHGHDNNGAYRQQQQAAHESAAPRSWRPVGSGASPASEITVASASAPVRDSGERLDYRA